MAGTAVMTVIVSSQPLLLAFPLSCTELLSLVQCCRGTVRELGLSLLWH